MTAIKIAYLRVLIALNRLITYRKLKRTFHGFTLNSMGELYELPRVFKESDRHYEHRLLRKAMKTAPRSISRIKTN